MSQESTKDLATIIRTPVAMRLAYLGCWIIGLLALIGGGPGVINKFQLPAGWDLSGFTEPVPLAFMWSVLVFLLYLFRGDNSAHYKKYLVPFQGIWVAVTLVTLVTTLNGYLAYHTVQDRLLATTANKTLASDTIQKLQESTDTLCKPTDENYSDYRRSVTYTHRLAQAALNQMNRAIDYEFYDLTESPQSTGRHVLTGTVETKLRPLLQIREILTETVQSLGHISASLVVESTDAQTGTIKSVSGQIEDVSRMVSLAGSSLKGLQFKGYTIFLWLSALNTIFILFPWTLLLLFIYRKRNNRAKQIYDDLLRLAPDRELLNRVLNTELRLIPDQRQPSRPISSPDGPETRKDRDQWIIKQLANQTFSNFEYVLNLLFFSLLIDVGWYFVFYPEASLKLTTLVRQGDGVKELTDVIVGNFTPLTMGFAGAYFYAIQMLVRRYLTNDLYPSAYLQASLRLLMVFILSLALGLLPFPKAEISLEGAIGWVGMAKNGLGNVVLLFAFVVGIFPQWGVRHIISWVSRSISSEEPDRIEDVPLNRLDGISIWTEERLAQRGIDNVQSLATASIERLVVGTPFSTAQIVDWIDQAILYIHAAHHNNNWFTAFQATGIRSVSDLLDASVGGWAGSKLQGHKDFKPEQGCLAQIVQAVNDARGLPTPPSAASTSAPPVESASGSDASDSAKAGQDQKICLTQAILKVMCEAIWPDPNIKYILNYYSYVTRVEDGQNRLTAAHLYG